MAPSGAINESYWPRLREILRDDPNALREAALECVICQSPMSLNLINPRNESAIVFHCGHILSRQCVHSWLKDSENMNCPLCKQSLRHPGCGHLVHGRRLLTTTQPTTDINSADEIALTLPEGGRVMDNCVFCHIRPEMEYYSKKFAQRLSEKTLDDINSTIVAQALDLVDGVFTVQHYGIDRDEDDQLVPLFWHGPPSEFVSPSSSLSTMVQIMVDGSLGEKERERAWEPKSVSLQLGITVPEDNLDEDTCEELGLLG